MYKKILIGYDGSEGSKKALVHAIQLAKKHEAELCALWCRSSLPHYPYPQAITYKSFMKTIFKI